MIRLKILLFLLLICNLSMGQDSINVVQVSYTFDINLSSLTEGIPYKSKLYLTDTTSLFVYNKIELEGRDGFFKKLGDRTGRVDGVHFFRNFDDYGFRYYLNFNTKDLISREVIMDTYEVTVKERSIDFKWEITDEAKEIGEYLCFKATTSNFRGRNYTAWFTYEIPVPTGPWKFHGLPGLILEAHDDKDMINISFNGIKKVKLAKEDYSIRQSSEILSLNDYLNESFRLYLNYAENRKAMMATGQLRESSPLDYENLEYNETQLPLLNQYMQIEYSTYELSFKKK